MDFGAAGAGNVIVVVTLPEPAVLLFF